MDKRIHLIGIGGIGMSGLALLLLKKGYKVSGSDIKKNCVLDKLSGLGAKIYIGHSQEYIKDTDLVVYSSAIREDNPEIKEARERKIPVIKRAEMLANLMRDKIVITVTGAHGKTTTTSLTAHLLLKNNLSPCFALGGILRGRGENALLGEGDYFVAEADESDGTFLYFQPSYSIITNVDYEHLDFYKDFGNLLKNFREFMDRTKKTLILFGDDKNLRELTKDFKKKILLYGKSPHCHIQPKDINLSGFSSEFNCLYKGKDLGRIFLPLTGVHNVINSLAVIGLAMELGIDFKRIRDSLGIYSGVERRFQLKLKQDDLILIDDYGHHPTEIRATLEATKSIERKRLICIFQPHRYTRTKLLLDDFCKCFNSVDLLIITDIYPANEKPIEGISSQAILERMREFKKENILYLPKKEIGDFILNVAEPGDLILTIGAGDIGKVSDELAERIKEKVAFKF